MKKIPCDLFGEGEYLFFNISRLAQFEALEKRTIGEIFNGNLGLQTIINAYTVGLAHHKRRNANWYADRLQELVDEGVSFEEFTAPVLKAIIGSGVFGKEVYYSAFPEELTEEVETELKAEKKASKRKN